MILPRDSWGGGGPKLAAHENSVSCCGAHYQYVLSSDGNRVVVEMLNFILLEKTCWILTKKSEEILLFFVFPSRTVLQINFSL
jgi:hypothetical protein